MRVSYTSAMRDKPDLCICGYRLRVISSPMQQATCCGATNVTEAAVRKLGVDPNRKRILAESQSEICGAGKASACSVQQA